MTDMPIIDPRVTGPPPERHAARIVAEMVKWLAGERARLSDELLAAFDLKKPFRFSGRAVAPCGPAAQGCIDAARPQLADSPLYAGPVMRHDSSGQCPLERPPPVFTRLFVYVKLGCVYTKVI
jgi:hypothetical protein